MEEEEGHHRLFVDEIPRTVEMKREVSHGMQHDDQEDEAYFDERSEADDDLAKGQIKFPKDKLFGREEELDRLESVVQSLLEPPPGDHPHSSTSTLDSGLNNNNTHHNHNNNTSKIFWISGPSGVGKSALVEHLQKRMRAKNLPIQFCQGKYNQRVSGDPFSAITQALHSMVAQQIQRWNAAASLREEEDHACDDEPPETGTGTTTAPQLQRISSLTTVPPPHQHHHHHKGEFLSRQQLKSLTQFWKSPDATLLKEIFPALRKLEEITLVETGSIPPCPSISHWNACDAFTLATEVSDLHQASEVESIETTGHTTSSGTAATPSVRASLIIKNDILQVALAMVNFLREWCSPKHPLLLYLDDLHWADVASLELLETLLLDDTLHDFLFVGSYRSNELEASPRLGQFLERCQKERCEQPPLGHHRGWGGSGGSTSTNKHRNGMGPSSPSSSGAAATTDTDTFSLRLTNLSPRHVSEFFMETLGMTEAEVQPLTELVYSKTLGNPFFCRQALEELARKNALYYDVMFFHWTFSAQAARCLQVDATEGDDLLSKSVVEMIQHKISCLSDQLQRVLVVASYIRHTIDVPSLLACVRADDFPGMKTARLVQILDECVTEGLVMRLTDSLLTEAAAHHQHPSFAANHHNNKEDEEEEAAIPSASPDRYVFAHDKVQEAAFTLVPPGGERHRMTVRIAYVLFGMATISRDPEDEWMFYVAAEHFNKVPSDYVGDLVQLSKLNARAAQMCLAKGSYEQAIEFLRAAVSAIYALPGMEQKGDRYTLTKHRNRQWKIHYDFLLGLNDKLMETELACGNFAQCQAVMNETLANGRSHKDKATAYYTKVGMVVERNGRNFQVGIMESIAILRTIGFEIPANPTTRDIMMEKLQLKVSLGRRSIDAISTLPVAEEDWILKLLSQLGELSIKAKNSELGTYLTLRALRLALDEGITKYLPGILVSYAVNLRLHGRLESAYHHAGIGNKVCDRFPSHRRGNEYLFGQMTLHSCILHIKEPFVGSMDDSMDLYRRNLRAGNVEMAMSAAMHFPMFYFASGLPLNALLEPKLILFEDKAKQLHLPSYEEVFKGFRQFLYNLQGKSKETTDLALPNYGGGRRYSRLTIQDDNNGKRMSLRDNSILRLALAFVYGELDVMRETMILLDTFPLFDLSMVREHLRLTYHGMAAFLVGRIDNDNRLIRMGDRVTAKIRDLMKAGSENARPLYFCLLAMKRDIPGSYKRAIDICAESRMVHLEAMMNEHCGLLFIHSEETTDFAKHYLGKAMIQYNNWGAFAKAQRLRSQFKFLDDIPRSGSSPKSPSFVGGGSFRIPKPQSLPSFIGGQ